MTARWLRPGAVAVAMWLPFFAMWVIVSVSFAGALSTDVLVGSAIATGSAGILGLGVWQACRRWPWPHEFDVRFFALQIVVGLAYGVSWATAIYFLELLRGEHTADSWSAFAREIALGFWLCAVLAGIAHAVQTRQRLHDAQALAARAEGLAAAARLDALRARLNPHFFFNALHTLTALVRFRPSAAEDAIERLGDMLRYTLKEETSGLVSFSEEIAFTRQYLAFEQLRFGDRLNILETIEPDAFDFDLPPFCIQSLAENAVRHAIATRPEGGSISITCRTESGRLRVSVRDDGAGLATDASVSHQLGLRSVRERLLVAFGEAADLTIHNTNGFEATFVVPLTDDVAYGHGGHDKRNHSDRG